jgi:hypothetical protein
MKTVIIHRSERTDREQFLLPLMRFFKGIKITEAVVPPRNNLPYEQAIVGCSASHLNAILTDLPDNEPLLVLEDDAVLDPSLWQQFSQSSQIPKDCGAIILGGDGLTESKGDWTAIDKPFFGSQAVIYLPVLKKSAFMLNAWRILATSQVGKATDGSVGLCYESVLMSSLRSCGLSLYRPAVLPFTTAESVSDRTGSLHAARNNSDTITYDA